MFNCEQDPLALLIELTPKLAKRRFRQSIYEAWEYKCGYCGDEANSLDHIVPRYKSGSSNRNNLLPCCRRCNQSKASDQMETWYRKQSFFDEIKLEEIISWQKQDLIDIFVYSIKKPVTDLAAS